MARPVRIYDYYRFNKYQCTGSVKELVQQTDLSMSDFYKMPKLGPDENLDPKKGEGHLKHIETVKEGDDRWSVLKKYKIEATNKNYYFVEGSTIEGAKKVFNKKYGLNMGLHIVNIEEFIK